MAPARWRCRMGSPAGAPAKRARCEGPRGPGSDPRLWDTERLCQHLSRCGVGDPSLLRRFRGRGSGQGQGLGLGLGPGPGPWPCDPAAGADASLAPAESGVTGRMLLDLPACAPELIRFW